MEQVLSTPDFSVTAGGALFALLLVALVSWLARKNGFFRLPAQSALVPVTFKQTVGAFLTYIIFALFFLPIAVTFIMYWLTGEMRNLNELPSFWLGWIQIISLFFIFGLYVLYVFCVKTEARNYIFWGEDNKSWYRFFKGVGMGALTWAISYPFVLLVSIVSKYIAVLIWGDYQSEQVAVQQLKMTIGNEWLFGLMIFAIIFLVPFVEELMFRGFLQNFLKKHLGRTWGIIFSSLIFAFAHFSMTQGPANFTLLSSLVILAFFLGFLYERERTLWASIGLHMTFNALSVIMIVTGIE